jgi:hypothetical protein
MAVDIMLAGLYENVFCERLLLLWEHLMVVTAWNIVPGAS